MTAPRSILLALLISAALGIGFGIVYFNDHAWGAWGDDSAGYIYLAGRMYTHKPLVYVDALAKTGLDFFGDERQARWLLPTHHRFINPNGMAASKYPLGASMLMLASARTLGSSEYFYAANPFLAAAGVVLMYLFCVLFFSDHRYRHGIGVLAALFLAVSPLYYEFAISQPMRELPSITFLLLAAICIILSIQHRAQKAFFYSALVLAGFSFGMAVHVRETSIMTLPAFALLLAAPVWKRTETIAHNVRRLLPSILTISIACGAALMPMIQNVVTISQNKVVFKERDTSRVVLLPNISHLQTISLQNAFDNQGKFRPGKGAIPQYWQAIQGVSPTPFFLGAVLIGVLYLWREDRTKVGFLLLWFAGIFLIFSLWINPYSRYILPTFPTLAALGAYGLVALCTQFIPRVFALRRARAAMILLVIAALVISYQPAVAEIQNNLRTDVLRNKAISRTDLQQLIALGTELNTSDQVVLMFSGMWKFGTSETLEAHTFLKTIRFPLSDQKTVFTSEEVTAFINSLMDEGRPIFVWVDSTSTPELHTWMSQYAREEVKRLQLSFEPDVHIYQLISHP